MNKYYEKKNRISNCLSFLNVKKTESSILQKIKDYTRLKFNSPEGAMYIYQKIRNQFARIKQILLSIDNNNNKKKKKMIKKKFDS